MNSRQRVLSTILHKKTDRIPFDYWARKDVTNSLIKHLHLKNEEELLQRFRIDIRKIKILETHDQGTNKKLQYLGGNSPSSGGKFIIHEDSTFENAWGIIQRQGKDMIYEEWVSGPFSNCTDLQAYEWPPISIYENVESIAKRRLKYRNFATMGDIDNPFKKAWQMRGFENFLCDMMIDKGFAFKLLDKVTEYEVEKGLKLIHAGVDIVGIYGDVAMQSGMLFGVELWRKMILPYLKNMVSIFKKSNPEIKLFFHSDGNIFDIMQDLIDAGFDIINPIQPECMDFEKVKREFGDKVTLHGSISLQRTLPFGSVQDVQNEVQSRIEMSRSHGGVIVCPSNLLQRDIPLENIVALYDAPRDVL